MATIYGTAGHDVLIGTDGDDEIYGREGNDRIDGRWGADRLFGEEGDDLFVVSSTGFGNGGMGSIDGGSGYDRIDVSESDNYVFLEWTDSNRNLHVHGQHYALSSIEEIRFGDLADTSDGSWGTLTTSSELSIFLGGGSDHVELEGAIDVYGETGDDLFILLPSRSMEGLTTHGFIDGGAGTDTILLTTGFNVDLAEGYANSADNHFRVTNVENVLGVATADFSSRISGNDSDNRIIVRLGTVSSDETGVTFRGRGGRDYLRGSNARDELYGDSGNDNLLGGTGNDRLYGGIGNDRLQGDAGTDRLFGQDGNDTLLGGEGDDYFRGGTGTDSLRGGAGNDYYELAVGDVGDAVIEYSNSGTDTVQVGFDYTLTANVENLRMRYGDWHGTGNGLDNVLLAHGGANVLHGLGGNDTLYGGTGRDTLDGGAGNDRLFGQGSGDILTGGDGADRFIFDTAEEFGEDRGDSDIITDFSQAQGDRINLDDVDANTTLEGDQAFTFIGENAFSGTAGELRYIHDNGRTIVEMDVDGDGAADAFLRLDGEVDLVGRDFFF